jgi:osmotically-inducible protein OsmY
VKTDLELRHDIEEELEREPRLNPAAIGVAVRDGIVMLTGYMDTYAEKWAAEGATKRLSDVRTVVDEIEVRGPGSSEQIDIEIAEVAENELASNVCIPQDQIKITVEKGWIILEGQVDRYFEKEAAESAVRSVMGVRGVSNLITVQANRIASGHQGNDIIMSQR